MPSLISSVRKCFSRKKSSDSNADDETQIIQRIVIDKSGTIGSYYNAYDGEVVGKLPYICKTKLNESKQPIECDWISNVQHQIENFSKTININNSLRLRIFLKNIQQIGFASLLNYQGIQNKHTRILYIYYKSRTESCSSKLIQKMRPRQLPMTATHIINGIVWGMHVAVFIQLPDKHIEKLHTLLDEIKNGFTDNEALEWTKEKKQLANRIISIACYSNIPNLNKLTKLHDIYQQISQLIENPYEHHPMEYILMPVTSLFENRTNNTKEIHNQYRKQMHELVNQLIEPISQIKKLKIQLDHNLPNLFKNILREQLINIDDDFIKLNEHYERHIQSIRDSLFSLRKKQDCQRHFEIPNEITDYICKIENSINDLKAKRKLINTLTGDKIEYCNAAQLGIREEFNERLVKDILFKNDSDKVIFCSTDKLKQQSLTQWQQHVNSMVNLKKKSHNLSLIYADFSYTTWFLERMIVLTSKKEEINKYPTPNSTDISDQFEKSSSLSSSLTSDNRYINILLLGESGVGKSTFINALANYLTFNTLEKAQSGKPVVIIPVSFIITVKHDFTEQLITFGDVDSNEAHNKLGQSVTQKCKSYVFRISHEKLLRIIDTPGFGDTRGFSQDDLNMENMFSFINNFEYLNCICLLLKPNEKELNRYWSFCFKQLIEKFGENICKNVCFCFTNSRSTFFLPGDTVPPLMSLLRSLPVNNIPFNKNNTFCFDSESFRYLVGVHKYIQFNDDEKQGFQSSWKQSVHESNRLKEFICEIKPFRRNIDWQSIEDVQLQVNLMNHAILQTIRNNFQNIILHKMNSSIRLSANNVDQSTTICYTCGRTVRQCGQFWILLDHLHTLPNTCSSKEQIPTQYRLDYAFLNGQAIESIENLQQQNEVLCNTYAKLNSFLRTKSTTKNDLLISGLSKMITDEEYVCRTYEKSNLNQDLSSKLHEFRSKYQQLGNKANNSGGNHSKLADMYGLMKSICDMPTVKIQIEAIKKYQNHIVELNEREVF